MPAIPIVIGLSCLGVGFFVGSQTTTYIKWGLIGFAIYLGYKAYKGR
ncbi:hypothetical protein ACPV5J_19115 [Vibrio rotiferianus]